VGHIGGDDFVVICEPRHAEALCKAIVSRFDAEAASLYDEEDRRRGYIEVTNRLQEVQRIALMSISIGVATSERRRYTHPGEVVSVATELKEFAKRSEGSSWAVDRRAGT
jgi:GGDEF domain-containing protein